MKSLAASRSRRSQPPVTAGSGASQLPANPHAPRVPRVPTPAQNRLDLLHCGLIPSWAKDRSAACRLINPHLETAEPAFRQAVRYHRCLVSASGLSSGSRRGGLSRLITSGSRAFAGLWEAWKSAEGENVESCSILTTSPNPPVAPVHDHMQVILHPTSTGSGWTAASPMLRSSPTPLTSWRCGGSRRESTTPETRWPNGRASVRRGQSTLLARRYKI